MSYSFSYPEELFKSISDEFKKTIFDSLKSKYADIEINGVWPFLYFEGSNSLKSIKPVFFNEQIETGLSDEDKKELQKTVINCDYGSIGFAFKKIKKVTSENDYYILHQTFNEPRGVVCYLDSQIRQEHAVFIAIKDKDNKILGILDLFFNGAITEKKIKLFAKELWNKFAETETLKRLCTNTFIIQQFHELQQQSNNYQNDNSPINPIKKIENILALSSNTPIFYFTYQDYPVAGEYVGLNFRTVFDFVAHEYRFCGFVKRDIECYYKRQAITKGLTCQNSLLTNYYYDIIKDKGFKSFRQECNISGSKYIVEVIIHNDKEYEGNILTEEITFAIEKKLTKELEQFKNNYKIKDDDFAKNKFKDEILFSFLKKKLDKAVVLILYREVKKPYLIYCGNHCDKHTEVNISPFKDFISPSELLHRQYTSGKTNNPLLKRAGNKDKESEWNVVHFEILKENIFIDSIKKRIANSPKKYGESVLPYLNYVHYSMDFKEYSDIGEEYKNLKFYYIGKNPLLSKDYYLSIIKEQISFIYSEFEAKETLKYATRAAIAQVMARNLSHMQGSHVLANVLNLSEPNAKDAKILLHYIKLRQEFLADVSTSSAAVNFPHNLYEGILSKFCPVTNSERGRREVYPAWENDSNSFYAQQNKSNYTNNYPRYVIDNISGKSNLKLEQVKFCYIFLGKCLSENEISFDNGTRTITNGTDISVDIPNDVLGFHALYVLLENIIRNSAKHSECSELTYNFDLCEDAQYPDYYKVNVIDNLGSQNETQRKREGWLSRIESYIYNSILKDNKLREGGWGILEMKICAAYLVSFPLEQIDRYNKDIYQKDGSITIDEKTYPPLLKVSLDGGYNLCHTFYLRKPKLALVIDKDMQGGLDKPEFKNKGIYTGMQQKWDKKGTEHSFLVLVANSAFESEKHENETNQDVLQVDENFLSEPNPNEFIDKIWVEKRKNCQTPIHFVNEDSNNDISSGIVFDEHGLWGNSNSKKLNNLTYYDLYGTQSATCQILKARYDALRGSNGLPFKSLEAQIREAAHTGIIVVDERIQLAINQCEKIKDTEHFTPKILDGMGIYIPIPQTQCQVDIPNGLTPVNLSASDFNNKDCLKWINHFISNKLSVKYLVIHLGIIEKLAGSTDPKNIIDWINEKNWLNNGNKSKNIRIVVTSGRGLPSNLPDGVLYVPISSVQQYVVNYRSKLMLVKFLKSVRKIYKNK